MLAVGVGSTLVSPRVRRRTRGSFGGRSRRVDILRDAFLSRERLWNTSDAADALHFVALPDDRLLQTRDVILESANASLHSEEVFSRLCE